MSAVEKVLEHLEGVHEQANGFWALCPGHEDTKPSLHIQEGEDGRALIKCRANCTQEGVMAALEARGFKRRDLFADDASPGASVVPLNGHSKASRSSSKGRDRLVKSYHVKDTSGTLRGIHERWECPDEPDQKSFKWKLPNGRYSKGNIKPDNMPLYGAELVAEWPEEYGIVLSEGETPAEALRARNIRALGTVCGASSTPSPEALEVLRGRRVMLWPDNDAGGREHMRRIARRLSGIAASVQWYEWDEAPDKGDAADHPAVKGGDREELKALARELRSAPEAPDKTPDEAPILRGRILLGKIMREGVEPPEELVPDILLAGKVHSLYSAASTGKTFLMLWLVLRVLERGLKVLIFDRENGQRILAERLEALGADPNRVDELLHYTFYPETPTTEEGLLEYENTLDEIRPALVVFDSLIGFLSTNGLDENSSNDVSTWATHYAHPARSRGAAVLLLDHVPKEGVSSRGSSRKRDEVDVMWALRNPLPFDRETVGRITIHREKDREGWLPESVGFSVGGGERGFVFARSTGTVEAEDGDGLTRSAHTILEVLEAFGPEGAKASEWEKAALEAKVSRTSFYRAKRSKGVENRISLQNGLYCFIGATGAKEVPRHQMAPAPDEVPKGATPLRGGTSGTGGDTGELEENLEDVREMLEADEEAGA